MIDYRTLGFTFTLTMLSLNIAVYYLFYSPEWHLIVYLLAYTCAFKTHFTSPGIVTNTVIKPEKPNDKQENFILLFSGHGYVKPPHAHYSKVTQRMVLGYDHFCIWVGNDIGLMNYRYFIQFVFWTGMSCICSLYSMAPIIFGCFNYKRYNDCNILYNHGYIIYPLWLLACIFFIFTWALFTDAMQTLNRGMSDVDVMKGHYTNKNNAKDSWNIYFGNGIPILYHILPWPNSSRIKKRRDRLESVCSKYFEDNGVKVVYK